MHSYNYICIGVYIIFVPGLPGFETENKKGIFFSKNIQGRFFRYL